MRTFIDQGTTFIGARAPVPTSAGQRLSVKMADWREVSL